MTGTESSVNNMRTSNRSDVVLQKYSIELLTCIDEMRYKRDQLQKQILTEMKEKETLQVDLKKLTDRLVQVNEGICDKVVARNRLDETICETQTAFTTMAAGSENLLKFMKRITANILPEITLPKAKNENKVTKKKPTNTKEESPINSTSVGKV